MIIYSSKKINGASLIDALMAMVVGAVGLLALAVFMANMMSSSGGSKTRAEAVLLAQQKMEQLRNLALKEDFIKTTGTPVVYAVGNVLINEVATSSGLNAIFTITSTITGLAAGTTATSATDPEYLKVKVTVSWTNSKNQAEDVFVASIIAWDDPTSTAARGNVTDITQLVSVGRVQPPSGGGRMAREGELLFEGAGISNQDGTFIFTDGDGNYQIAAHQLGNETLAPVFVSSEPLLKLSGTISTNGDPTELTILRVLTSDFGFCIYNEDGSTFSGSNGLEYIVGAGGFDDIPNSGDFNCYIAASWHGNLGVLNKAGTDFCSAAHRYRSNCSILDSVLYLDATGSGSCPYTGFPVNGLIGELEGQNFLINNGGCEVAELEAIQPSITGNITVNGVQKPKDVEFSSDGGDTYIACSVTLQGPVVDSYKCVSVEGAYVIIKLIFDNGNACYTEGIEVGTSFIIRDIINKFCDAPAL